MSTRVASIAIAAATMTLAGCGGDQQPPEYSIMIDDSGSSTSRNLPAAAYQATADEIKRHTQTGSYPQGIIHLSHARADSMADPACPVGEVELSFKPQGSEPLDDAESAQRLSAAEEMIREGIACAQGNHTQGSDILGGIVMTAEEFQGSGPRTAILVTDGRVNAEPVHLRRDGMSDQDMADELKEALAQPVPDLHGVDVVLVGIGADTASKNPLETQALMRWWREYLASAGASSVSFVGSVPEAGQ